MTTSADPVTLPDEVAVLAHTPRMIRLSKSVSPERFQVLGERCSGTNYVRVLVERNLALAPETIQPWKHGFPTFAAAPRRVLFFAVFRNALDWVRSMYAKPWHSAKPLRSLPFREFLRHEWRGVVDWPGHFGLPEADGFRNRLLQYDRHPVTGTPFANPIALRNAKAAGLLGLELREVNVVFCTYESVVADPEAFLSRVAAHYGLERRGALETPDRWLGDAGKLREMPVEKPPRGLAPADRRFVMEALDLEQEKRMGYQYTSSTGGLRGIFSR